jgi:hypothetical protein
MVELTSGAVVSDGVGIGEVGIGIYVDVGVDVDVDVGVGVTRLQADTSVTASIMMTDIATQSMVFLFI